MKHLSTTPTNAETVFGYGYLSFQMLLLPSLLSLLPEQISLARLNLLYYAINFLSIVFIFRKTISQDLDITARRPMTCLLAAVYGLAQFFVLNMLVSSLLLEFDPEFINANDDGIAAMVNEDLLCIALGTIVLVPPAEELIFRGLIFRKYYEKNPVAAYLISMSAFSALHLIGYLTVYTPKQLLIAFLQYLPAGFCLARAYARSGSILSPILIHALVNTMGIALMR